MSVCRPGSMRCCCLSVGLAPDWVEEGNDEDVSVVGGPYFGPDPTQPASACPAQPLATDLDKTECGVSDAAGGQFGFSHLTLGQWSVLADQHRRHDTTVSQGDTDGGGVSFDATAPTALTHSCSVDGTGATWCVAQYQGCGPPCGQGGDVRHHAGVSADPLMTDPCLVAPPLSCGGRPRQVMLSYSASDNLSTCLDHVTDTSSATDTCEWYQPVSDSRHYSEWATAPAPATATVYGLNPSDTTRMQDATATQWCGSHDVAPHSCYGNSTWYYSGGEQAKPASVKKIQQVRCVDMPVTNGNSLCVGGPDTVGVDHRGGHAFVGDQLESPSYRTQDHASSQCYQWRQPCTGYSTFQF